MKKIFLAAAAILMCGTTLNAGQAEARAAYAEANQAFKNKQYSEAIDKYKQVVKEEPGYASYVQGQIGHSYYGLGEHSKALYYYDEHLKAKPNDATVQRYADALKAKGVLPDSSGSGKNLSGEITRSNVIFINPAGLALGTFNLGYERAITDHNSFLIDGVYQSFGVGNASYTTMGGSVGWHFSTKRLNGWFIGPKVGYLTVNYKDESTDLITGAKVTVEASGSAFLAGGEFGYQWLWDNGFMLNLGGGANYVNIDVGASASASSGTSTATASGSGSITAVLPTFLLNLGYAF